MIGEPTDLRPVVAMDWSFHGIHVTFDGDAVEQLTSVDALLADARLEVPHRIAAESTFESWDVERRYRLIADIRAAGHELFVYRPLHTARARGVAGIDKSDANDALVIWALAHNPTFHLYRAVTTSSQWAEFHAAANREYVRLRLSGAKPEMAAAAAAILGPIEDRSDDSRLVLGASKGYSETLLAALYFVARKDCTRAEMERLIGLHASGYPSLLRSEIHTHSFRHARKRLVAQRDDVHDQRAIDIMRVSSPTTDPVRTVKDWTVYRREMRRAFHEIKAGLAAQATGTEASLAPE